MAFVKSGGAGRWSAHSPLHLWVWNAMNELIFNSIIARPDAFRLYALKDSRERHDGHGLTL